MNVFSRGATQARPSHGPTGYEYTLVFASKFKFDLQVELMRIKYLEYEAHSHTGRSESCELVIPVTRNW